MLENYLPVQLGNFLNKKTQKVEVIDFLLVKVRIRFDFRHFYNDTIIT